MQNSTTTVQDRLETLIAIVSENLGVELSVVPSDDLSPIEIRSLIEDIASLYVGANAVTGNESYVADTVEVNPNVMASNLYDYVMNPVSGANIVNNGSGMQYTSSATDTQGWTVYTEIWSFTVDAQDYPSLLKDERSALEGIINNSLIVASQSDRLTYLTQFHIDTTENQFLQAEYVAEGGQEYDVATTHFPETLEISKVIAMLDTDPSSVLCFPDNDLTQIPNAEACADTTAAETPLDTPLGDRNDSALAAGKMYI